MWYGKLCVILYVFSFSLLFSGYYMNQIFNDPNINQNGTYQALTDLKTSFNPNLSPNSTLIFGDFISAFKLLVNLMSGGVFNTVFGDHGFMQTTASGFDASMELLMGLLFDSATLFFILYIVSNRSI